MRSWGAEEGLLGAFRVGPGDWLGAREDSQRLIGTEGLWSLEGILPAHLCLLTGLRPQGAPVLCSLRMLVEMETPACLRRAWLSGMGRGLECTGKTTQDASPGSPFFRGETKAPNGEVFSQDATTIWRQAMSSSLPFSFPACVFVCFFVICLLSHLCVAPGHRRLSCV